MTTLDFPKLKALFAMEGPTLEAINADMIKIPMEGRYKNLSAMIIFMGTTFDTGIRVMKNHNIANDNSLDPLRKDKAAIPRIEIMTAKAPIT